MRIAAATAARVRDAAESLGYRPNAVALALRSNSTQTIAMISDLIATNEYSGQMVAGALETAHAQAKLLIVAETHGDPDIENAIVQDLLDRRVDGFIYATEVTRITKLPELLTGHHTVMLNCIDEDNQTPSVVPDERAAGVLALAALGTDTKDIAVVGTGHPNRYALQQRLAGIRAGLPKSTLLRNIDCDWWPESAFAAVDNLLRSSAPSTKRAHRVTSPRAFICMNDQVAFGTYQALHEHGLTPGRDVSVVSFDGSLLAGWLRPGLTSVSTPHRELGQVAVSMLTNNWETDLAAQHRHSQSAEPILISPALTTRTSVSVHTE
jgi:LacI family transcriptional regulator